MEYTKKLFNYVCKNNFLQGVLIIIFMLPLIATFGQFINSGYIKDNTNVDVLFWPGIKQSLSVSMPVFIIMGAMAISYLIGIIYMCKKKTFVKVTLITIAGFLLANILGKTINMFTGWSEHQNINSMDLNGLVNRVILVQWHNPVWEELFFTGIPLVLFLKLTKNKSDKVKFIGNVIYYVLPSILTSIYHIPNHGLSRIVDSFIFRALFQYLALEYSFFAPLVMHYIADAIITISLYKIESIPKNEITYLTNMSNIFNTTLSICVLIFLAVIVVRIIIYIYKNNIHKSTKKIENFNQ